MLNKERQDEIMNYLRNNTTVSVAKLTKILFASEATIRRDLTELEKSGLIKKIYGGATIAFNADTQIPFSERQRQSNDAKVIISEKASKLIKDGQIIFIDGSSTAQFIIPYLYKFKNIIVITNGLKTAEELGDMHIKTFCTGGLLIDNSYTFSGHKSEEFIKQFNADICFISCKGMTIDGKFTDTSESETELRKLILQNSKIKVILLTSNKIGQTYLHSLCNSCDVDYIFSEKELPSTIKTKNEII